MEALLHCAPLADIGDDLELQMLQAERGHQCCDDPEVFVCTGWSSGTDLDLALALPHEAWGLGPSAGHVHCDEGVLGGSLSDPLDASAALLGCSASGYKPGSSDVNLDELTRASRRALMTAARHNQTSVRLYNTPVQPGAWQGCTQSPWCNACDNHAGPCNAKATIPGVLAYISALEYSNEVDDKGAILGDCCDEGAAAGQADSSVAGSGKHGSSSTHHAHLAATHSDHHQHHHAQHLACEQGEVVGERRRDAAGEAHQPSRSRPRPTGGGSSPGEEDAEQPTLQRRGSLPRSLSVGHLPGWHAAASRPEQGLDAAGLPVGWAALSGGSGPRPGAADVLPELPDALTAATPHAPPQHTQRMAPVASINASWRVSEDDTGAGGHTHVQRSAPSSPPLGPHSPLPHGAGEAGGWGEAQAAGWPAVAQPHPPPPQQQHYHQGSRGVGGTAARVRRGGQQPQQQAHGEGAPRRRAGGASPRGGVPAACGVDPCLPSAHEEPEEEDDHDYGDDYAFIETGEPTAARTHMGGAGVTVAAPAAAAATVSRRATLRATRSVPNFRSMALGGAGGGGMQGHPSAALLGGSTQAGTAPPPHGLDAQQQASTAPARRVVIHCWPSSSAAPSAARRPHGPPDADCVRASHAAPGCYPPGTTAPQGLVGLLVVPPGGAQQSSAGGPAAMELASPLSSCPSSSLTTVPVQRLLSCDTVEAAGELQPLLRHTQAPRHGHNLRGRGVCGGGSTMSHSLPDAAWPSSAGVAPATGEATPAAAAALFLGTGPLVGTNGLRTSRLPEVPPPQTHGGKKRSASGGPGSSCARPVPHPCGHVCTACGTSVTPVWRAGPQGPKTLCNACGVRYMKVAKRK